MINITKHINVIHAFSLMDIHTCTSSPIARYLLQQNNVHILPWVARSANVSTIEHLWDILDRRVRRQNCMLQNVQRVLMTLQN